LAASAAVRLLVPADATHGLPWLGDVLNRLADLAANWAVVQREQPSRSELRRRLLQLQDAIMALEQLDVGNPVFAALVLSNLLPDACTRERIALYLHLLSRAGAADLHQMRHWPTPKLIIACGVMALCQRLRTGSLPGRRHTGVLQLCGALLQLARIRAGEPALAIDTRESNWAGSLDAARQVYAAPLPARISELPQAQWSAAMARSQVDTAIETVLVLALAPCRNSDG
jgi:hypothetical protein